jgi:hypothetical protein
MKYIKYPACHEKSPYHEQWLRRVEELEKEGCTTSDAQAIADMEFEMP